MTFRLNYRQERAERDRRARLRKAEKQKAREENASERKAGLEPKAESPAEDGEHGS